MEKHMKAAVTMANVLENQFSLFGVRFGLTAIFELIPEIGNIINLLLSLYIIWIAIRMEIPIFKIMQMIANILINFLIGILPVAGEVMYVTRKANLKNVQILQQYSKPPTIEGQVVG